MKQILLVLIILQVNYQSCGPGCLRCTKDEDCLICDTTQNLVLKNFECVKEEVQNCKIQTINGECQFCQENFYLDETTSKCIAVDLDKIVDGCYEYDQNQICLYCKSGNKFSKGECTQVQQSIPNCLFYGYSNNCIECVQQYVLNLNGQCIQSQNCQVYQEIKCLQCQSNYILNQNYYFDQIINAISTQQKNRLLKLMLNSNQGKSYIENIEQCQPISIQNCTVYESYNKCKICNKNFFLGDDKKCYLYPSPSIPFCQKYLSLTTCGECSQKYILETQYSCIKKEEIENCVKYDGTSQFQKCILCDVDYYLKNNICLTRQFNRIANCLEYRNDKDACQICDGASILSNDGLKCGKSIQGCHPEGYAPFYMDTDIIQCYVCQDEYYFQDYKCQQGQIDNCKIYIDDSHCEQCKEQYYLTADKKSCNRHDDISHCLRYSQYQQNVCIECQKNYYNSLLKNQCKNFQAIKDCKVHSDTEPVICLECQPSTFLLDNTTCQKILVDNCDQGTDENTCTKCSEGYGKLEQQCILPLDYVQENCEFYNTLDASNAVNTMNCQYCKSGYQPINLQNNFLCIKNQYLSLYNTTLEDDCVKYKDNICVQCSIDKFLLENNTCGESCTRFQRIQSKVIDNDNKIYDIQGQNICQSSGSGSNCKVIAENLFLNYNDNGNYQLTDDNEKSISLCIKCEDDYTLNFQSFSNFYFTNININQQNSPYITDPNYIQLGVPLGSSSCVQNSLINSIDNCSQYFIQKCLRCDKGYTGIIITNRINQCLSITDIPQNKCLNKFYQNLHPLWEALFSCHVCEIKTQLPVLFIKGQSSTEVMDFSIISYTEYDYESQGSWNDTQKNDRTISCLEARPETFGSTTETATWYNIPSNCALMVMNLSIEDKNTVSPTTGVYPLFCASCRPGYTPNMNQTQKHFHLYVKQCNVIENCTGKSWFNACSKCNTNYTYEIKKYDQYEIRYDTCIESKIQNCYAEEILQDEIFKRKCHFCKKGFVLNQFGQCEGFKGPQCTAQENFIIDIKKHKEIAPFKWNLMRTIFYMRQEGLGCSKCITDYSAIYINQYIQVCVESEFTKNEYFNLKETNEDMFNTLYLIDNCEQFFLQKPLTQFLNINETYYQNEYDKNIPKLKCKKCKDGYFIDATENFCIKNLKNCKVAQRVTPTQFQQYNNFDCEICNDLFAIIKIGFYYQCQLGEIKNCKVYVSDKNEFNTIETNIGLQKQSQQYCRQCNEGFYLDNNHIDCIEGNIDNCAIYIENSDIKCKQCLDGFVLVKKEQKDYCLEISEDLQCKKALIGDSFEYQSFLECEQCQDKFQSLNELNTLKSICMHLELPENCEELHVGDQFSNSLFDCIKCNENYFLNNNNFCQKRINKTNNCNQYSLNSDTCIECDENYFLQDTKCIIYPNGLSGCQDYQDYQICIKCLPNMFLNNGSCEQIIDVNKIENCIYYKNSNTCEQCKFGYFLLDEGKLCQEVTLKNCLEFEDFNKCKKCEQNYGLTKTNDNSIICELIVKSNCLIINQDSPYDCLQCDLQYYPFNGECKKVQDQILNCLIYDENQLCEQCAEGTIESEDKKICIPSIQYSSLLPKNCKKMKKMNQLVCLICQPGQYFLDGSCQQCQVQFQGCYACYPEEPDKCFVCNIGYYMNKEGICISQIGQQGESEVEENLYILKNVLILIMILIYYQQLNFYKVQFQNFYFFYNEYLYFNSIQFYQFSITLRLFIKQPIELIYIVTIVILTL